MYKAQCQMQQLYINDQYMAHVPKMIIEKFEMFIGDQRTRLTVISIMEAQWLIINYEALLFVMKQLRQVNIKQPIRNTKMNIKDHTFDQY